MERLNDTFIFLILMGMALLIALKLLGIVSLPWWIILAPLLLVFFLLSLFVLIGILSLVLIIVKEAKKQRRGKSDTEP